MTAPSTTDLPTIVTRFGFAPLLSAVWQDDPSTGLASRDLAAAQASQKAFTGRHLRAAGIVTETDRLIPADCVFSFLFVLVGKVELTEAGGQSFALTSLDSATRHGPGKHLSLKLSHDAEIILLNATRDGAAQFGSGNGTWSISREQEDDYIAGNGPRAFFRYRDLAVSEATGRRIHIQLVRATGPSPAGGTGWHIHGMGQLFYILRGHADISVINQQSVQIRTGDAMCIAKAMAHNVTAFSRDYLVLEMCIPADYETVPTDENID